MKERLNSKGKIEGKTKMPEYWIWVAMKRRCHCPKHGEYFRYGARGITVCSRWFESFENFIQDMGRRPEGLSLERIDSNGNYCPENCKWADNIEQSNNTKRNHFAIVDGIRATITQHSRRRGISPPMIFRRLLSGCTHQEAFDMRHLNDWKREQRIKNASKV